MTDYSPLEASVMLSASARLPWVTACEKSFANTNEWLREFGVANVQEPSALLLEGALSASVEVVSTAYLGLMRQAICSLRIYYELSLAWLYYKDHPVEWGRIEFGNEQVLLPAAIQKYLREYMTDYETRWKVLCLHKTRTWDDPYKIMSGFVHGGLLATLPKTAKPSDIVFDDSVIKQLPPFISAVCEYIDDTYICASPTNWESLPKVIKDKLCRRLGVKAKASLAFI